jgi:predicted small lipoprotein YifL
MVAVATLAIGQMMAACGQKGDLYLPEPEPAQEASPAPGEVPPPEAAARQG